MIKWGNNRFKKKNSHLLIYVLYICLNKETLSHLLIYVYTYV